MVLAEGSEMMFMVGVGDNVGGRAGRAVLLKHDAVGTPFHVCISRPSSLKVSLMIPQPAIMSSLVLKGKLPSSRYSMRVKAVMHVEMRLMHLVLCPVSCPVDRELLSRLQWSNWFCQFWLLSIKRQRFLQRRS